MRIAHIITRLIVGGAQENTLFTVAGLVRAGHAVDVVSGPTTGPEGSLEPEVARAGARLLVVPSLVRQLAPAADVRAFGALVGLLRRGGYDVVHTHSAKAGILGRAAARAALPRALVVHSVHGLSFHPFERRLRNFVYVNAERLAAPLTDHFICVGEVMRDRSLAAGIGSPERYSVIYSGFDVRPYLAAAARRAEIRAELSIPADAAVIGMIGRLFPLKGQEHLLDAFASLAGRYPAARLLFVGGGVLREALERTARERSLAGRVIFTGLVAPARIPEYVAAMDIAAHPSFREGLPKAVAQAFAGGRPVVAFDADGARELVRDGETGYLVAPGDTGALAGRLAGLLDDPAAAARMGRRGQERVLALFPVEKMVADIEAVYRRLLAGRAAS